MIRSFVAVDLEPPVIARITQAIAQLKPTLAGVRWVSPENFHLTLKFLGDIEENRVSAIDQALREALRPFPRCTINAKGLGVFPDPRRPRILWVGLAGEALGSLAAQVEAALVPLGFPPETRGFTPHLTIGRWRQFGKSESLARELAKWRDVEFGPSVIDKVTLFQSTLTPQGAIYRRLEIVELQQQPR